MRGDSLRDFYAKTLALLGLALVGAIGALVDHWPASHPIPVVSEPLPAPASAGITARADVPVLQSPRSVDRESVAVPRSASARHDHPPVLSPVRVASAADVLGVVEPIAFEAPAPTTRVAIHAIAANIPVAHIQLVAPEVASEPAVVQFAQHGMGHGPADQGFLTDATDAAKKAGTSIMSGTVKTGASIVDGLRSVGGAVRRGLWRFVP